MLRRFFYTALGALQIFLLLAAMAKPAHAYVDPGSGQLFLQVGSSMLAGAVFMFRSKVKKLLRIGRKEPINQAQDHSTTEKSDRQHGIDSSL
ncbi:MAG: hypothetical protein QM649_00235 [Silvibacterium sp.]